MWRLFLVFSLLCVEPLAFSKPQATGYAGFEIGKSYPQGELASWLESGTSFRVPIFAGAALKDVPFLSAIGLGWDLNYATFALKTDAPLALRGPFHYKRFMWDWFFLPVDIGYINFTPGITWVFTDVLYKDAGIREMSIRPGLAMTLGLHVPVHQNFVLLIDGRWETAIHDDEPTVTGEDLNITGDFLSAMAGARIQF